MTTSHVIRMTLLGVILIINSSIFQARASVSGRLVFIRNGSLYVSNVDGSNQRLILKSPSGIQFQHPAVSVKSTLAFSDSQGALYIWPIGKSRHHLFTSSGCNYVAWSPDGKHIACDSNPQGIGNPGDVTVMDANGANQFTISSVGLAPGEGVSWANKIFLVAAENGSLSTGGAARWHTVYIYANSSNISGSQNQLQRQSPSGDYRLETASPDAQHYAVYTCPVGHSNCQLNVFNYSSNTPATLAQNVHPGQTAFSADGSAVAFTKGGSIFVESMNGGPQIETIAHGSEPAFSPI